MNYILLLLAFDSLATRTDNFKSQLLQLNQQAYTSSTQQQSLTLQQQLVQAQREMNQSITQAANNLIQDMIPVTQMIVQQSIQMAEVAMQESLNVLDGAISDEAAETLREMVEEIGQQMTEFSEEMIEDAAQGVMNLNNDNAGTANIIGTQWAINASNTLNNLVSILTPNQNSQEGS